MKTVITFFVCFLCLGNTFSQTWFADDHKWTYRYFNPFSTEGYGETKVEGDIMIDGREGKVLVTNYTAINVAQGDSFHLTIRNKVYEEDSRVYLLTDFDYPDLLYDFNLEIGDSITYRIRDNSGMCIDTIVYHLDSLSTERLNSEELIVQHFTFYDPNWQYEGTTTITEKVGRTSGGGLRLDHRFGHICFFDAPGDWLCAFREGTEEIKILDQDCYELPVNTNDIDDPLVKVYPNPATDEIFIENYLSISNIQLYSMEGHLLSDYKPQAVLDISLLNPGAYVLRMLDVRGKENQLPFYKI